MFNPKPQLTIERFGNGRFCIVIDDVLIDPEDLVRFASDQRDAFQPVDFNAYPGMLLPAPAAISLALNDFFIQHVRRHFDARRSPRMHSRFALVTLPAHALKPGQRICHRDSQRLNARESIQASVLYLFKDSSLGGTGFYEPAQSVDEAQLLLHATGALSPEEFDRKYSIPPGYMCESNAHFRRVGGVAAKWNRMIFYDGSMLHSGDITTPEKLSADPSVGRLTLNGFFTCRRKTAQ
jgi:hypothetical protein